MSDTNESINLGVANSAITTNGTMNTNGITISDSTSVWPSPNISAPYPDVSAVIDLAADKLARMAAEKSMKDVKNKKHKDDCGCDACAMTAKSKKDSTKNDKAEAAEEAAESPAEEATETPEEETAEQEEEDTKKKKKAMTSEGITGTPDGRLEPEEVNYRMSAGTNKCSACSFFVAAGTPCKEVDAPINPENTCDLYQPMAIRAMSMVITKASVHNGVRRWAATASDTDPDQHGEACTTDLFKGFMDFFNKSEVKPFLGVAHYPRLDGKGVAGEVESVYMDGKKFKAKGTFSDTPLGDSLFNAVANDRMNDRPDKIRISLAWWDLGHTHGEDQFTRKSLSDSCPQCAIGKHIDTYTSGYLDHLAATRVPVNRRTELSLEMKSMTTRKEDAESIVGEIEALQLENVSKGTIAQKALVVRSNTGLPAEAYALVPDKAKSETWKVQIWENDNVKTTPAQLAKAAQAIISLSESEKADAIKVVRSEYRQLGVKAHEWPETVRPEFPAVPTEWDEFAKGVVKLASDADSAPYIEPFVKNFQEKAFTAIEADLAALETMVDDLTQKGETMEDLILNENDPFENSLLQFKSAVEDIQRSPVPQKDKVAAVKAKFDELSDIYCQNMFSEKSAAPAIDVDAIASALFAKFEEKLIPVTQQIALINERLNATPVVQQSTATTTAEPQKVVETPPQRKSIAQKSEAEVQKSNTGFMTIDQIARATTVDYGRR